MLFLCLSTDTDILSVMILLLWTSEVQSEGLYIDIMDNQKM